jgi:hypothetical protein
VAYWYLPYDAYLATWPVAGPAAIGSPVAVLAIMQQQYDMKLEDLYRAVTSD